MLQVGRWYANAAVFNGKMRAVDGYADWIARRVFHGVAHEVVNGYAQHVGIGIHAEVVLHADQYVALALRLNHRREPHGLHLLLVYISITCMASCNNSPIMFIIRLVSLAMRCSTSR